MRVRVRLFALARQVAGSEAVEVELPDGATVGALRRALGEQLPALTSSLRLMLVAVNTDYASDDVVITPSDEIALIPPVSGG